MPGPGSYCIGQEERGSSFRGSRQKFFVSIRRFRRPRVHSQSVFPGARFRRLLRSETRVGDQQRHLVAVDFVACLGPRAGRRGDCACVHLCGQLHLDHICRTGARLGRDRRKFDNRSQRYREKDNSENPRNYARPYAWKPPATWQPSCRLPSGTICL